MEVLFETNRMLFIRPNINYVEDYLRNINNPVIYNYLFNEHDEDITLEQEIDWVERHQEDYTFTLIDRQTNEFIGNCGFNEIENNIRTIGIMLDPKYQNIGLGTEAIRELINIGFNTLNLDEIRLIVFSDNERAIRCYRRLGFEEYQRVENVIQRNNEEISDIYMRLTR
ncbi:MAG: GNAT family N-acetyltransferase [Bacilli bacterium]|nr:GNAT family N-acetyltransferase [Bacilli bacterium]